MSPSQMQSVQVAMEQAVAEAALKFEQRMSVVSIALSGAPFIGLLGTVWGVMDSFAALAEGLKASADVRYTDVDGADSNWDGFVRLTRSF
mgnify:CR=1 FL=1